MINAGFFKTSAYGGRALANDSRSHDSWPIFNDERQLCGDGERMVGLGAHVKTELLGLRYGQNFPVKQRYRIKGRDRTQIQNISNNGP